MIGLQKEVEEEEEKSLDKQVYRWSGEQVYKEALLQSTGT